MLDNQPVVGFIFQPPTSPARQLGNFGGQHWGISVIGDTGPEKTPLKSVEGIWGTVFPGRSLEWRDWKPFIRSHTSGSVVEYSGNQMSDGEKAALYLSARVFNADPGVLVVDEPETHFHSLLAVRLWNALEKARPDLRFVYVTHDLTFALSRRSARYVLASPTEGLRAIDIDDSLPHEVASALLGSASLSFYASRIVFCEGEEGSKDAGMYSAWFDGVDTVVKPVGSCQNVLRCVSALNASGIASSLEAIGVIDRDFQPDAFFEALPPGVVALSVHEVESLLALPEVVEAVAAHQTRTFDSGKYESQLHELATDNVLRNTTIQRWKSAVEPKLVGIVAGADKGVASIDDLAVNLNSFLDPQNWSFDPERILRQEEKTVKDSTTSPVDINAILRVLPGKAFVAVAARTTGLTYDGYVELVTNALKSTDSAHDHLRRTLSTALTRHLPARTVKPAVTVNPL